MGTYHVFISCDAFHIEEEELERFLNKILKRDAKIKCIPKSNDLSFSRSRFDRLKKSSIYVVNVNKELDKNSCWELGYAMGNGLEVIGYSGNLNEITICDNFKNILNIYDSDEDFVEAIGDTLPNLIPKDDVFVEDWEIQRRPAEIERGHS